MEIQATPLLLRAKYVCSGRKEGASTIIGFFRPQLYLSCCYPQPKMGGGGKKSKNEILH